MTKLYPFQKRGVEKIIQFKGRCLLADEMGLGKTLQTLTYLKRRPKIRPALVICPASAKWVWADEARKHYKMDSIILSGTPFEISAADLVNADLPPLVIINYDILSRWLDILLHVPFKILIVDECHYIKTYKAANYNKMAQRTKMVHKIGRRLRRILALSGTPLTNRPSELYSVLHLLFPEKYKSYTEFAFKFCGRKYTSRGWDDSGHTNLSLLHRQLRKRGMIRRRKKQVLKDLPDKTRIVVPLDIENIRKYQRAEKTHTNRILTSRAVRKLQGSKPNRWKDIEQGAFEINRLTYLKRLAAQLKMKAVIQWIDNFLEETDGKLVVFAHHKTVIKKLHETYGKRSVVVDGSITGKDRTIAVRQFQNQKKIRLFIGNIIAAGTAITLTAGSTGVFVELDWVPGNHVQAEDRLHRIGQKKKVFIYYLVAKGTIEEKLCNILQEKFNVVSSVLDGKKGTTRFDIFSQLIKALTR
jgi:SWI/SNF-related matrix-associated actin-dependent regulator 1 of chromatin subfamily A